MEENFYLKQTGLLGVGGKAKLDNSFVMVIGNGKLAKAVVRDLVLTGIGKTAILPVEDSSVFNSSEPFPVHPLAESVLEEFRQLNHFVEVEQYECTTYSVTELVADATLTGVIFCLEGEQAMLPDLVGLQKELATSDKFFVAVEQRGTSGVLFVYAADRGKANSYTYIDAIDNRFLEMPIASISRDQIGRVVVKEELQPRVHFVEEGKPVAFANTGGMQALNDRIFVARNLDKTSFEIGDTSAFTDFQEPGLVRRAFLPVTKSMEPMDIQKMWGANFMETTTMIGFKALWACRKEKGTHEIDSPSALQSSLMKHAKGIHKDYLSQLGDKRALPFKEPMMERIFGDLLEANFAPVTRILAGIATQQAINFMIRMYTPLVEQHFVFCCSQWLHDGSAAEQAHQAILQGRQVLVVGAGAIGCEVLSNLVEIGVGGIYVLDFDKIALSNLHRQALFREKDQGRYKSEVAVEVLQRQSKGCNMKAFTEALDARTAFGKEYFEILANVDCYISAVDNRAARTLLYHLSLFHNKPFFDAGTGGLRGSTQVAVPGESKYYPPIGDQVYQVASCYEPTIYHLPEHAIHGASSTFEAWFHDQPYNLNQGGQRGIAYREIREQFLQAKGEQDLSSSDHAIEGLAAQLYAEGMVEKMQKLRSEWSSTKRGPPHPLPLPASPELRDQYQQMFIRSTCSLLKRVILSSKSAEPTEAFCLQYFSKEDPVTVDFMESISALLCQCYDLPIPTREKVLFMAAKMANAIITSTAVVSGFLCINVFKHLISERKTSSLSFKNLYLNLSQSSVEQIGVPEEDAPLGVRLIEYAQKDETPIGEIVSAIMPDCPLVLTFLGTEHDFEKIKTLSIPALVKTSDWVGKQPLMAVASGETGALCLFRLQEI